jgi:hypothetical protein
MTKLQLRILYRQFLFRVVDLELLSFQAQGDASKLLGQFAALLIFLGALFSMGILGLGDGRTPRATLLVDAWGMEHVLIATTMLVVGVFAVLSWDSAFPDKRDVLILAPLPVRPGTLFLAKVGASATALCVTVVALNGLAGMAWPLALSPPNGGILDLLLTTAVYRTFAAYWITVILAGAFVFGAVLCLQGLAVQLLPRRRFLRVSALLQMTSFGLLVSVYFLQPSLATPQDLIAPGNQGLLAWLPSYWFLALFQQLNGSMHHAMVPLVRRAWIGLAVIGSGTAVTYLLAYLRMLPRIVEEPDITPGSRRYGRLPGFGSSFDTAVVQFSIRTLLRSRQHRLVLAFYLGIGFAITIRLMKTPAVRQQISASINNPWHVMSGALLASSIVMMSAWIVGVRVVCSVPLDLRANWIFRIIPLPGTPECLASRRRTLIVLGLAPVWIGSAVLFLSLWSWKAAVYHLAILGLVGATIVEACLQGPQRIPFTCSWLPGRSNLHVTFWLCVGLLMTLIDKGVQFEQRAIRNTRMGVAMLLALGSTALLARWRTRAQAHTENSAVQFEDELPPVILGLGLHRDGTLTIEPPSSPSLGSGLSE